MPRLSSFKVVFFFLFLGILDCAVLPAFRIGKAVPSSLDLFVCYAAIRWETKKTIPVAFWGGLLKDLLGGGLLGIQAGVMTIAAAGLDQIVRKAEWNFPGIHFLIAFFFVFICGAFNWALSEFAGGGTGGAGHLGCVLGVSVYTAVLFPVFSFFADIWFGSRSASRQYELFR